MFSWSLVMYWNGLFNRWRVKCRISGWMLLFMAHFRIGSPFWWFCLIFTSSLLRSVLCCMVRRSAALLFSIFHISLVGSSLRISS